MSAWDVWVVATDERRLAAVVGAARSLRGAVTVVAVGPRALAESAAALAPDGVRWVGTGDDEPAEARVAQVADAVAAAAPRVVLAAATPADRVLLGGAAARRGAPVVACVQRLGREDDLVVLDRAALGGAVVETVAVAGPVAVIVTGDAVTQEAPAGEVGAEGGVAPITRLPDTVPAADLRVEQRQPRSSSGVRGADRVVSVGRGLRAKGDLGLVERLTAALGAELACSMPVADDLGWVDKDRYVGRSGQHIAPRLYLALGISGMPQHLEGVRGAKVVAAVNADPDAPIFRTADYGVVGDLYEVVPALVDALGPSA